MPGAASHGVGRPTVANEPRKLITIHLDAKSRAATDPVDSVDS